VEKLILRWLPVGDGQAVLKYLAPYVHRVAISDQRILAVDASSVMFSYAPSGTSTSKTRTVNRRVVLPVAERCDA